MFKNFMKENEAIVNAYYQGLGEKSEPYTVPHALIEYHGYLGNDASIRQKVMNITNETDSTGKKKYKRILIVGGTGCGKTTFMAEFAHSCPGHNFMVEPNKIQNLQNQADLDMIALVGGTKASAKEITTDNEYSVVYDLAGIITNTLINNPSEPSLIIIDEPQELYYARTYRQDAIEQLCRLENFSSKLDNSTVIHITATPDVLVAEMYDYIIIFEDVDRIPIADKLDIVENTSKLSFEEGVLHLLVDMVRNKKEKVLVQIQSIEIIDKIRDNLNSLGITAVSLTSKDKDTSSTYTDHQTGELRVKSYNDMYKTIVEKSCLPKFTFNNKEISVYLSTSILGQGSSIKGILDENGNIEKDANLIPVYTVKDKPTCSIDYVLQFLARPRFHVNRAVVYLNKENYDAKIQQCINIAKSMPGISLDISKTGNYYISTNNVKEFKDLKRTCKKLGLDYEKYEETSLYKIVVFGTTLKTLPVVMEYHLGVAKTNLSHFLNIYNECDFTSDNLDKVNETLDNVLGLYCIDGSKNSINIIKRNEDGLYIDKELLWLNIYMHYIGQYYRCNNLYYQELSLQLDMPFNISALELTDIDLEGLKQQHQELIHETLSHAKSNDPGFKAKILKNQLSDEMKWLNRTEEFKYLSALTKLTDDLDYAYEIISKYDIEGVKDIYDKELRKKLSVLTSPEKRILESLALTKETGLPPDDVAKLIIESNYWLHITRGLKLGVSIETLCYQFGKSISLNEAKNYVHKTQTVNLLKKYTFKELKSFGRAGMEIVVALSMFYDIHNCKFFDGRNEVTIKDIDNLRIALNENKVIKSLRYDTSGIGKGGAKYTKKDAKNLLSCIFTLGTPKDDAAAGVLFILLRIAKAAKN